jgi:hypothetical protein
MTDQPTRKQSPWQSLKAFSRDGYGTDKAGLTRNRNRLLYGVGLALLCLGLMASDLIAGTHAGLPKNDQLVAVTAPLVTGERTNEEITLTLEGQKTPFSYPSKAMGEQAVWGALCKGCITTLWTDPADTSARPVVFQVAVQGRIVRRYADVKQAWIDNNSIAPWIGGFLALAALLLGGLAAQMQSRLSRINHAS